MKRTKISLHLLEDIADGALTQEELQGFVCGGDGTYTNPCSIDEYYSMLNDGTWSGGYIIDDEGSVSYVPEGYVRCYHSSDCSMYSGHGRVLGFFETTLSGMITSELSTSAWDLLKDVVFDLIPFSIISMLFGLGEKALTLFAIESSNAKTAVMTELAAKGYNGKFDYVITNVHDLQYRVTAIAPSGEILSQQDFSVPGMKLF